MQVFLNTEVNWLVSHYYFIFLWVTFIITNAPEKEESVGLELDYIQKYRVSGESKS